MATDKRASRHLDEKSAFRPYGRDVVVFFTSTRWAFPVKLTPNRPTSGWLVIRPESGSLGYSAHLKHSVIESAVLQQSSRPPPQFSLTHRPCLDWSNE